MMTTQQSIDPVIPTACALLHLSIIPQEVKENATF